jgi:hypothetical protein
MTESVRAETEELLSFFTYAQLPAHLQERSQAFSILAHSLVQGHVWSHELVACLRALLIAKDAGVRALLVERRLEPSSR